MHDALESMRFRDLTVGEFVERLGSAEPVPGGGSAAAVAASLGAALVTMVASLSLGREKYAQHVANLQDAAATGRGLSTRLLQLAEDDALAYGRFAAAMKLPRDTNEEQAARRDAIGAAARRAAEVPLETLRACLDVAAAAEKLAGRSNVNASSDLGVAALLSDAAARAAGANVLVNLPSVNDPDWADEVAETVMALQEAVSDVARMTREVVGSRESRKPIPSWASEATEVEA